MLIRVRAIRRGQYANMVFEPGEILELPHDKAGLAHTGPAGEQLGWTEPVSDKGPREGGTHHGHAMAAYVLAQPIVDQPADGLWRPGTGAHDAKLKRVGMFTL
jgi:hypothetical protein